MGEALITRRGGSGSARNLAFAVSDVPNPHIVRFTTSLSSETVSSDYSVLFRVGDTGSGGGTVKAFVQLTFGSSSTISHAFFLSEFDKEIEYDGFTVKMSKATSGDGIVVYAKKSGSSFYGSVSIVSDRLIRGI